MLKHLKPYFLNPQTLAVGIAFWVVGFMFGNWATLIPSVKLKFNLDDAQLGLLLLSLPAGAISFNPVASLFISKIGMKKTFFLGFISIGLSYALPLSMPTLLTSAFGLLLTGMSISLLNVSMNTCAAVIEQNNKVSIMSSSHGMFSIGLMSGSLLTGVALSLRINPTVYMLIMCVLVIGLAFVTRKQVFGIYEPEIAPNPAATPQAGFKLPTGVFLLIIIIGVCSNIAEGAMADWTAIYMREVVATQPLFVGWGLAGYSLFMALGRFLGDGIIPRFGQNKIMVYGGLVVIIGLLVAILFPHTFTAIIGFSLVGAGISCAAPILYGSATRVPNMSKGSGLATMNTFAMGGFLLGPVAIGFVSEALSLPIALAIVALLMGVSVGISRTIKFF